MRTYPAEVLDLVQASTLPKVVPMIYCYIHLDSRIDLKQLKYAVNKTAVIVPQILCEYHPKHDCWCSTGHTVEEVVKVITSEPTTEELIWDVTTKPQIRIFIRHMDTEDKMIIAISHIIMDGSGFQQYIKLLMDCYNQTNAVNVRMLNRNWLKLCSAVQKKGGKKIRKSQGSKEFLLSPTHGGEEPIPESLYVEIDKEWMNRMVKGTKSIGVTINDFLLAGYAETIVQMGRQREIIIPVPADIRTYCKDLKGLTIANMTGKYQCPIR